MSVSILAEHLPPAEKALYDYIDDLHGACLRAKYRLTEARDPEVLRIQLDNIAWAAEKVAAARKLLDSAPCPDCALGACTVDHGGAV